MLDKYAVILRGERFTLYRDQIEFDAPNYFTSIFLGDFAESQTRSVELSRSPNLFRIIVNYLSGYTVLPLTAAVIPGDMTFDMARANLLRDAEFFAHVTVDGVDAVGKLGEAYSRVTASASSNVDGGKDSDIDGLTRALHRIWKAEDTKQSFVYAAEEIVFTIRPSAKSPPIEVCILAARFVSRANAASRLL
ncbi:hypothetical protein EXIGLDRAFT_754983 [Exidia glandulosa HHB12029]|uniref:BTB domain-containing protein n=1 Tax=Exidia glandulosa HHB12029 TaxID=1314781 RepID=A0A165CGD2_EXIGL|nr:hypothetical protein EXIGLDRAFT_754983 [Exidia glandulosa HHB12029]